MPAPSLVLGTAGHIDHGKSTLVKALTGTDPDRLAEEKERGITIELGFAQLSLPSGRTMGVVDVPGHERFVRQMVAGATGIDVVLLVVAADDGIMPQTREHLAIIDLLGIPRGVVAITKADLADPEWLELVAEEVRALLVGTSIDGAPVVPVSARTGVGLPELLVTLDEVAAEAEARQSNLPLRLPVDRVFTIAGAGTVVTGTLWSGSANRDDAVELMPSGKRGRIRSVQMHGASAEKAVAGNRVALNIAGLDKDEIDRGDIVAEPGSLTVTDRFDARLTYLASEDKPFESGTRVHVHHGTREVLGRVLLMDTERLAPGTSGLAQLRLEEPLSPRYDDRFIIRSYSPMWTIGGGVVLDVLPPRRTTLKAHERELLEALVAHDLSGAALGLLASRALPMTSAQVASAIGVPRAQVADDLNRATLERLKVAGETYFVTPEAEQALLTAIETELLVFHDANPSATGIGIPALRDRVDRRLEQKVFDALLAIAAERGGVVLAGGEVRHPKAASTALAAEGEAAQKLSSLLAAQGLSPKSTAELAAEAGVDAGLARKVLGRLTSEGSVVRLGSDLHFDAAAVERAREQVVSYLREHGEIYVADARDVTGSSRKYIVPLLEYFDAQGVTKREGDFRTLGKRG
ncbi:MAG: selenocysteine-specific translation elongation factor [Coriobacteriia bacterium]|nr:selenocysteine-specific translation elongation factor [Coriobacteriia bacterium]MBN2848192.1 selenocysteine-specific translation elongation factor [Coriobacteriia bacterium]